jgi:glycosyltransferase involved in cell wall biosynthesis
MRVLLSHVYAWPEVLRGGERILHELGAGLHRAGVDVEIVTTAPRPGRSRELGVPVTRLSRRHLRSGALGDLADEGAFGLQALGHALRRRPTVWHALGTADAAWATRLGRVTPMRSVYTSLGFPAKASRAQRPDRRAHETVVAHVDRYCTLSADAAEHLRAGWDRDAIVLPGGVDTRRFHPDGPRAPEPTILFPAALDEPRKNLGLLLEALELVLAVRPTTRLWIVGTGADARIAAAPVAVRDAIDRHAASAEAPLDLYRRAWVTALPAVAEAQGLVVIESLACGTPVTVLEGGAPAEAVVAGTGSTAREEPASLSEALLESLDLAELTETVEACRARSMAWDWDTAIVPRTLEVYR